MASFTMGHICDVKIFNTDTQQEVFDFPKIPIRKNKKRRIQKKWNKKYGMKVNATIKVDEVYVPVKGTTFPMPKEISLKMSNVKWFPEE